MKPAHRAALAATVAAGVALRLSQFLAWRSLWMDEAMLAVNVVERSWAGLLQPLEYNQGAPVLFLFLQKAAVTLAGAGDAALRVVPVLASCLSVALFARVALDWCGRAGLVAVALLAACPPLVAYAAEAKQYPVDVAVSVALLAALGPWVRGGVSRRAWIVAAAAGAVAPWCSHPAAFVLPGAGLVVAGGAWRKAAAGDANRAGLGPVVAVALAWGASFALLAFVSLRGLAANAALLSYWRTAFAPFGSPELESWTARSVSLFLSGEAALPAGAAGLALVVAGLVVLGRRRIELALALVLPLVLAFVASGLRLYPFDGRLLHFAVPLVLLAAAAGAGGLADAAAGIVRRFAPGAESVVRVAGLGVAAAWLLWVPVAGAFRLAVSPRSPEHLRPALEFLASRRQAGEALYLYYGAKPAFRFYAPLLGLDDAAVVPGRAHRGKTGAYRLELAALGAAPGAWLVLSHPCCPDEEWAAILEEMDRRGRRVEAHEELGAAVFHYRFDEARPGPSR